MKTSSKKSATVVSENLAVPEVRLGNELEDEEEKDGESAYCIAYDNAVPEIRIGRKDSRKKESRISDTPKDEEKQS